MLRQFHLSKERLLQKFIFTPDKHVGFENKKGKLTPLHDEQAINAMLSFASDFKPDVWIEGGDNLDCGPVSHWLSNQKASLEQLDLRKDCQLYNKLVLKPINSIMRGKRKIWMMGNHEAWLYQAIEDKPGLRGVLDVQNLLPLDDWEFVDQGENVKLGKLAFIHGDTLPNVKNIAGIAIERNNLSVAFGHFHTFQTFTKHTMLDSNEVMTGFAVPGLCRRNPNYAINRPNQWLNGFMYGYIQSNGEFTAYVPIIIRGRFAAEGKTYKG
jgi:hypothetical protein